MVKKIIAIAAAVLLLGSLAACNKTTEETETETTAETSAEAVVEAETVSSIENADEINVLVAVFNPTGETGDTAEKIAEITGGTLFEIKTEIDYEADGDVMKNEIANNEHPVISDRVENMSDYGAIIIGFPEVDGELPMEVMSFLEEYDVRDKVIIPFVSGESESYPLITNKLDTVSFGSTQTVMKTFTEKTKDTEIRDWLTGLGF